MSQTISNEDFIFKLFEKTSQKNLMMFFSEHLQNFIFIMTLELFIHIFKVCLINVQLLQKNFFPLCEFR